MALRALAAATILTLGVGFLSPDLPFVFAQQDGSSSSVQGSAQSQIVAAYKTAYPKMSADSNNSVTVQSEHHLYKPGDTVKITGSVSSEIREQTESNTVTIKLVDAQGTVVANQQASVDSNGEYSAEIKLPATADEGEYSVGSKVEVEASVLGLLDAQIVAKLESSPSSFVVAEEQSFEVNVQTSGSSSSSVGGGGSAEQKFTVYIASNSRVENVTFKQEEKMMTFTVEGETGTKGVTQVTIPKAMLSGSMTVMIDGQVVSPESNDVIVTSDTSTETTFEINYAHSKHDIAVTGTNAVPEFPVSMLIMAVSTGAVIAVITIIGKRKGNSNNWFS